MKEFLARSSRGSGAVQTLLEHSENTAETAGFVLKDTVLAPAARLAGLIHDMGKATDAFGTILKGRFEYDRTEDGTYAHSTASVRYMLSEFHTHKGSARDLTAELIALAAGSHHSLFDLSDGTEKPGFRKKMESDDRDYEEARKNFLSSIASEKEINELFAKAEENISTLFSSYMSEGKTDREIRLWLTYTSRMLISAVMEGDRYDAAAFGGYSYPLQREVPDWADIRGHFESLLPSLDDGSPVSRARARISDEVLSSAEKEGPIYSVNVPTGGGKTLTSMRFALRRAELTGRKRIIVVTPFLSVTEQNAAVLRSFMPDGIITEHHSDVIKGTDPLADAARENWQNAVIMTTLSRFMDTCFSSEPSNVRRFHALSGSVIVFDEVQQVPREMKNLFVSVVGWLASYMGAEIVFSSATVPFFNETDDIRLLSEPVRTVSEESASDSVFDRTEIRELRQRNFSEMPALVRELLKKHGNLLVIVNRKDQALELFEELRNEDAAVHHLSTFMCPAHRENVLQTVKEELAQGRRVLVISTQIMQTGVDISFRSVLRFAAGLSDLIQASGRCNRNGEAEGVTYWVHCTDEDLRKLRDISREKNAFLDTVRDCREQGISLFSEEAAEIEEKSYVRWQPGGYGDGWILKERRSILDMLSANAARRTRGTEEWIMQQAAKSAGSGFSIYGEPEISVIVPWGDGKRIIAELERTSPADMKRIRKLVREAAPYTVSTYSLPCRWATVADWRVKVLGRDGYYDEETGCRRR